MFHSSSAYMLCICSYLLKPNLRRMLLVYTDKVRRKPIPLVLVVYFLELEFRSVNVLGLIIYPRVQIHGNLK